MLVKIALEHHHGGGGVSLLDPRDSIRVRFELDLSSEIWIQDIHPSMKRR